ncbi:MAG TPA: kelch repeat-containing protein, partial [Planctomycetota bacterium]|nr:kelch repeat-containing protein [Planctomycetota bacterium]
MGGIDATGNALASTEIATATGATPGPHLATARVGHTATHLNSGKVLVAGGQSGANATTAFNTTELYDPTAGTFSAGATLAAARSEAIAIEFGTAGNLQVLIAGGSNGTTPVNTAEVYNETTGTSTALTAMMVEAHAGASAALMDDGTVLIVGGVGASGPAGAEIFDPTTNTFSPATMTTKRSGAAFASTGSEAVVAGGQASTGIQSSSEDYAISTKTFASGATLATARMNATASVVGGTNVLFCGGQGTTGAVGTCELLSGSTIAAGTISAAGSLKTARFGHTATTLSSGAVLVIGGFTASGAVTNSIESVTPPVASTGTGTTGSTGSGSSGLGGLL